MFTIIGKLQFHQVGKISLNMSFTIHNFYTKIWSLMSDPLVLFGTVFILSFPDS